MKNAPTQLEMRENTASSRRHASRRAVTDSFTQYGSQHPAESSDRSTQELGFSIKSTFELPLTEEDNGATGGGETARSVSERALRDSQRLPVERPLTCEEAAAFVRVHPKTVKRMARTGELPGHFRFGSWFFYASELDCWMRTELHSSRHSCR
jgi:excisionase family DNA binding protein